MAAYGKAVSMASAAQHGVSSWRISQRLAYQLAALNGGLMASAAIAASRQRGIIINRNGESESGEKSGGVSISVKPKACIAGGVAGGGGAAASKISAA